MSPLGNPSLSALLPAVPAGPAQPRCLVLGGGGITGSAWEVGLLAGLAELGLDLRAAAVVIGTSAGSTVGVQKPSELGRAHV